MLKDIFAEVQAIGRSSKFSAFLDGVEIRLPTGQALTLKIQNSERSVRPMGLRFAKHAFMTEISGGSHIGTGFGEADTPVLALQKSISEAVERVVYYALKGTAFGSLNSNGWAAHVSRSLSETAAIEELLERDSVLVHWLCQIPMTEIALESSPRWLRTWNAQELVAASNFNRLQVLMGEAGHISTLTAVLRNAEDHAVLSHACASTPEAALRKALIEACRIAQLATEGSAEKVSVTALGPEEHVMLYAHHERLPSWILGKTTTWNEAVARWRRQSALQRSTVLPEFLHIQAGPLSVSRCTSSQVQSLYFGRTEDALSKGLLNFDRLRRVKPRGEFNLQPHCIG